MHTKTNVGKKSSADIGLRPWFDILSMWKMALEHFVIQFILSWVATLPSIFRIARKRMNKKLKSSIKQKLKML